MEYRKNKRKFTLNEQKIIGGPTLGMVCGVTSVGEGGGGGVVIIRRGLALYVSFLVWDGCNKLKSRFVSKNGV